MSGTSPERLCARCGAPNGLDLGAKCVKCRTKLSTYCFACFAPIGDDAASCAACGRGRWVVGDFADLPCVTENGKVREHRYMTTFSKKGTVLHEWRCMKCLTDQTRTDALTHFPERATATP